MDTQSTLPSLPLCMTCHQPASSPPSFSGASGSEADATLQEEDRQQEARQLFRQPPDHPEDKHEALRIQAANIIKAKSSRNGIVTHEGQWRSYDLWHTFRFGWPAPRCSWTGLIWLDRLLGTEYMSYMAASKKTSAQVTISCLLGMFARGH